MRIMASWGWLSEALEEEKRGTPAQTTTNDLNSPTKDDGSSKGGGKTATSNLRNGSSGSKPTATNLVSLVSMNSQPQQQAQKQQTPQAAPPRFSGGRRDYDTPDKRMYYICDDCGAKVGFYANELHRCLHCGGMTMKKPRIKGVSQFAAV